MASTTTNCKRQLLLGSLIHFFEQRPAYKETMYNIIQGLSPISLRVLDWFVTHYAKVHQTMYWFDPGQETGGIAQAGSAKLKKFHVYFDYRAQLKSFSKTHFDPFRRHERISFMIEERPMRVVLETTVGQLNFFKWALENRVIQYVMSNLTEIETSMAQFYQQVATKKKGGGGESKSAPAASSSTGSNVKHVSSSCLLKFD